jgi:hypothetical protein
VSAPQPLTGDELATIKARAEAVDRVFTYATDARHVLDEDVPRLLAEIERLRAQAEEWRVWFDGSDAPTAPVDERTARRYMGLTSDRIERRFVTQWETVE